MSVVKMADLDRTLLRYCDSRSPAELSLLIGGALTPEECAARVSSLLEKSDWLSMTQQDALVTLKMRQLIAELEDQPRSTRNAEVLIRALEALGNRLEKRSQAIESDLQRLYAWQGQVLIEALTMIAEHLRRRLPEVGEVDEETWNTVVEEGIRRAGAMLASHEGGDGVAVITSLPEREPEAISTLSPKAAGARSAGSAEARSAE